MPHRRTSARDASDLALVGRLVASLAQSRAQSSSLSGALDLLRQYLGADASELFLLDPVGGELFLTALAAGSDEGAFCSQERFELEQGYPGIVAGLRPTLTTTALGADPRFLRGQVTARGYQSFACVRLARGERLLGTIHVGWKSRPADLSWATRVMRAVGAPLSTAVVAGFADLAEPFSRRAVTQATLTKLAHRFQQVGAGDRATVVALGPDGRPLRFASTADQHLCCEQMRLTGRCGMPNALPHGRCVVLDGPRQDWPSACQTLPDDLRKYVAVPVSLDDGVVGYAYVGYGSDAGLPSTRHLADLVALGTDVAPVVSQFALAEARTTAASPVIVASAASARLRLCCLGPFGVRVDGTEVQPRSFSRGKAVEMLKLFALHPGRVFAPETIIERLWPDSDASASRLHVTLHALRRAIEPPNCGRQWVHVKSVDAGFVLDASTCYVDIEEFKALLAQPGPGSGRSADDLAATGRLERAVDLYRGELLAGDASPGWATAARELYRGLYLGALVALARRCFRDEAWDRGLALLKLATAAEPTREDIHQLLIQSLWGAGRRADARRQYELCVSHLRQDLGVDPLPETMRLGQQVGAFP